MPKKAYVGVDNVARKVNKIYVGVNGVARKVVKGYVGVNGVARQFWPSVSNRKVIFENGQFFNTWNGFDLGTWWYLSQPQWGRTDNRHYEKIWNSSDAAYLMTSVAAWKPSVNQTPPVALDWEIDGDLFVISSGDSKGTIGIPFKHVRHLRNIYVTLKGDSIIRNCWRAGTYNPIYKRNDYPMVSITSGDSGRVITEYETVRVFRSADLVNPGILYFETLENINFYIKKIEIDCDSSYLTATHEVDEYITGNVQEVNFEEVPSLLIQNNLEDIGDYYSFYSIIGHYSYPETANDNVYRVLIANDYWYTGASDRGKGLCCVFISKNQFKVRHARLNHTTHNVISGSNVLENSQTITYAGNTYYYYIAEELPKTEPSDSLVSNLDYDLVTRINTVGTVDDFDFRIGEIAYIILDGTISEQLM